jgi:hypothetical protein
MSQTRANDGRCLLARRSLFRDTQRCANTSLMIIQEIRILCPFKSDSPALAIAAREDRRCCRMFNVGVNGIHRTRVAAPQQARKVRPPLGEGHNI